MAEAEPGAAADTGGQTGFCEYNVSPAPAAAELCRSAAKTLEANLPLFAVDAAEVDRVADGLESALGLALERRDSSYWGEYRIGPAAGGGLRVYANRDPMYIAGVDPPDDEFFEPEFGGHGVLVEVHGAAGVAEAVRRALHSAGGVVLVR